MPEWGVEQWPWEAGPQDSMEIGKPHSSFPGPKAHLAE